jgi:hypothetical protein
VPTMAVCIAYAPALSGSSCTSWRYAGRRISTRRFDPRGMRVEGLVVLASPLLSAHRKSLIAHAASSRLPATYEVRTWTTVA